jgi:hypothetical protein
MKYLFAFFFLLAVCWGCTPSGTRLENKLKKAMEGYLHKGLKPGTEVTVKTVTYTTEKNLQFYDCKFLVHVQRADWDTTGIMRAIIKTDFSDIVRTQ